MTLANKVPKKRSVMEPAFKALTCEERLAVSMPKKATNGTPNSEKRI